MGKRGPKPKERKITWSPKLAYAVGLIASDGCLLNDGRHLDFTSVDKEQIQNFVACMDLQRIKVGRKNKRSRNIAYRVQWGDVVLCRFLLEVGLTPNKSKTLGALEIPDGLFFDFLRGSFDGDGSFYSYFDPRWRSSFMYYLNFSSASPAHLDWLRETLRRLLGVGGHISKTKTRGFGTLRYAKREALVVLRALYSTSLPIHLKRKRLKIEKALRIVGESLTS